MCLPLRPSAFQKEELATAGMAEAAVGPAVIILACIGNLWPRALQLCVFVPVCVVDTQPWTDRQQGVQPLQGHRPELQVKVQCLWSCWLLVARKQADLCLAESVLRGGPGSGARSPSAPGDNKDFRKDSSDSGLKGALVPCSAA